MKYVKKLLLTSVVASLTTNSMTPVFAYDYAKDTIDSEQTTTTVLDFFIRFDHDETLEEVQAQNITVSLTKKNTVTTITKHLFCAEGCADDGIFQDDGDIVSSWKTTFTTPLSDVEEENLYTLSISGAGYQTLYIPDIDLSRTAKSITVGTGDGTFAYGDLNGDNQLNEKDISILEEKILANDETIGLTDYTKLVSSVKQIEKLDAEALQSLVQSTYFLDLFDEVEIDENEIDATISSGELSDLFQTDNTTPVIFQPTEDAEEISIPIDIVDKDGLELSEIQIKTPSTQEALSGEVMIEYIDENGKEQTQYISFAEGTQIISASDEANIAEGISLMSVINEEAEANVVVISLGTRVAVKKITVTIELDEDSNPVAIQEVTFLQDIVPENPYSSDGLIENLSLSSGDKSISLKWDVAPNVGGYRVSYGESSGKYTNFESTTTNSITISVKENLVDYYFIVQSTYDDWTGVASSEIVGQAMPSSKPASPTSLSVTPKDQALVLSWTDALDAATHNVYYKHEDDTEYTQIATELTSPSYTIAGLTNDETYYIMVSGVNIHGEGPMSAVAEGIPEKINVDGPILPEHNRILNDNIISVTMRDSSNYDSSAYPNGFSTDFVWDEDYSTYWTYKNWFSTAIFDFTFDQPQTMDYVIWVPRVEDNSYAYTLAEYYIEVWCEGEAESEVLIYNTATTYNETVDVYTDENGIQYVVMPFEKRENIEKISVGTWIRDGGSKPATLSEIAFYEYDPIADDIADLFANTTYTELNSNIRLDDIEALEKRLEALADFVVRKSILESELALAKSLLLTPADSLVGYVKDDFISINTSSDSGSKLSSISPLGVVGLARYDILVYAELPEGETLSIYPSQFYNSAGAPYSTSEIVLKNGRNVVNIPDLTNISGLIEGGQLYYHYSGSNADDIKLHFYKDIGTFSGVDYVSECIATPTLEIYNYDLVADKAIVLEKITQYIEDLDVYMAKEPDANNPNKNLDISYNQSNNPINTTEISMRHTLLSLPASGVYDALGGTSSSTANKVTQLYNNALAWEEINYITLRAYGDETENYMSTRAGRQNIRTMRMSASAFMYAGGNHIGIQYGSTSIAVSGTPTSVTHSDYTIGDTTKGNSLFGWGIAHEIGHNLDRIGILEVTNNIYSMLVDTYDGIDGYGLSSAGGNRIPYSTVFSKVSSGATGSSADIFAQLGMYWQLHLAYANEDMLAYYADLFGAYNDKDSYAGSNRFEVLASQTARKDLTNFFTAWGVSLSDEAKTEMAKLPAEPRQIQYLSDESRELRLLYNETGLSAIDFTVEASVSETDEQTVILQATHSLNNTDSQLVQGYEVYRDGIKVGFTTTGTYYDYFGSMNNKSMEYDMVMVDKLGNICSDKIASNQVRIEYDNVIDQLEYTIEETEDGLKLIFNDPTSISGIRFAPTYPEDGSFTIEIGVPEYDEYGDMVEDGDLTTWTAKEADFSQNEVDYDEKFINYFLKVGAEADDTRIGTYDAKELTITSTDADTIADIQALKNSLDIISYVGDNISFSSYVMGRLQHDFMMGNDLIEAGTILVVGDYVGDPYFNEITIEGRYVTTDYDGTQDSYDLLVAGDTYMFATVPEDKVVSTISDGLFIFIPHVQEEEHTHTDTSTGTECDHDSSFPTYMRAVMTRNDSSGTARYTTITSWEFCPSFDTIPEIIIE